MNLVACQSFVGAVDEELVVGTRQQRSGGAAAAVRSAARPHGQLVHRPALPRAREAARLRRRRIVVVVRRTDVLVATVQSESQPITHTHTPPFNGPLSGTTRVSRYQKGKTSLDFTGARDSEWQWHQLGRIQVCTALQTDSHASTPPLSFLHAG